MQRREFIHVVAGGTAAALLSGCGRASGDAPQATARRVLVVAFDGLDPRIVESLMRAGRMPNFARLAHTGCMTRIATSNPPQTPVAFANIISGADPGLHQVFDFIHRDPNPSDTSLPVRPYFSTADAARSQRQWTIPLGSWQLPLTGSTTELLRRGPAFWDYLVARGIDTQIYYLPSNYPPQEPEGPGGFRMMSGMGTPDLLGSYGEFTLFTPDAPRQGRAVGGGRFAFLSMVGDRGQAELVGPPNFLRQANPDGQVESLRAVMEVVRDARASRCEDHDQRLDRAPQRRRVEPLDSGRLLDRDSRRQPCWVLSVHQRRCGELCGCSSSRYFPSSSCTSVRSTSIRWSRSIPSAFRPNWPVIWHAATAVSIRSASPKTPKR